MRDPEKEVESSRASRAPNHNEYVELSASRKPHNTGWGESGKVILQVSIAVFWALSEKFSGKDRSAPTPTWRKIGPYAYGLVQ